MNYTPLPVELQLLVLENLYEPWHLCTKEAPAVSGKRRLALEPSIQYEKSPLMTCRSWRQYSITMLARNFQGILDMTTADTCPRLDVNEDFSYRKDITRQPACFELTGRFAHLYHRITTLRFENSSMLFVGFPLLRPLLPNLDTIELIHKIDYQVPTSDLSGPRCVEDVVDLVNTTAWDRWLNTWLDFTWYFVHRHLPRHGVFKFNTFYQKSFVFRRADNARIVSYQR